MEHTPRVAPPSPPHAVLASGALAIGAIGLTLLFWIPVARRLTEGARNNVVLVDTATMPGLIFDPGDEGNPGMVRLAAIIAVLAVVAWVAAFWTTVARRDPDYVYVAGGAALANLAGVALFLVGTHDAQDNYPFVGSVHATSGWAAWALLPVVLTLATRLMVPDPRPPGSVR
ncbi:MAG: hypothetical protein ABWX84_06075 [Nocardioides sp.]